MKRRVGVVVVGLVLVASGCGGDGNDESSAGPTGTNAAPTTVAPKGALTAEQVVVGLRERLLPIGQYVNYTAETDPNNQLGRPNGYTSKVNFNDTRLVPEGDASYETESGGSVEVFANSDDAEARFDYIRSIAKNTPLLNEYDYREEAIVLRLSQKLTPDQAAQYQAAFEQVVEA
jgi:hypothetical protein